MYTNLNSFAAQIQCVAHRLTISYDGFGCDLFKTESYEPNTFVFEA